MSDFISALFKKYVRKRKLRRQTTKMETAVSVDGMNDGEILSDAEKQELQKLLASVVYKRKTVPAKCMKLYKEIILYDIKRLETAEVKLEEDKNHQRFMSLVKKLGLSNRPKISFDDLNEAEKRLLMCQQKLKDINTYFKKRKQFV